MMLLTEYLALSNEAREMLTRTDLLNLLANNSDTLLLLTKFEEVKAEVTSLHNDMKAASQTIVEQSVHIQQLKTNNSGLKRQLRELDQYNRRNNVQISGLKLTDEKNCETEVIRHIQTTYDVEIHPDLIEAAHPVPTRRQTGVKPIIVKFISRKTKENLLSAVKRNRTRNGVYINEHLSAFNRFLFNKCLPLKTSKDGDFKYLWTKNGTVMLRKEDGSPVIRITNERDLMKVNIDVTDIELADY